MKLVSFIAYELIEVLERRKLWPSFLVKDPLKRELLQNGFVLLPRFFDKEYVDTVVEELIAKGEDIYNWKDQEKSDNRAYQAERSLSSLDKFYANDFIKRTASWFYGTKKLNSFILLNKLIPVLNNKGSGGGWHRDSPTRHQFKAILYLSDVSVKNGPFQIIPKSNRKRYIIRDFIRLGKVKRYRFTDEDIGRILSFDEYDIKNIVGPPGSLLLVDTKAYHRGMPIIEGQRLAATIYFFKGDIPKHMIHG